MGSHIKSELVLLSIQVIVIITNSFYSKKTTLPCRLLVQHLLELSSFQLCMYEMFAQFASRISCFASSHKSPEMAHLKHSSEGKW